MCLPLSRIICRRTKKQNIWKVVRDLSMWFQIFMPSWDCSFYEEKITYCLGDFSQREKIMWKFCHACSISREQKVWCEMSVLPRAVSHTMEGSLLLFHMIPLTKIGNWDNLGSPSSWRCIKLLAIQPFLFSIVLLVSKNLSPFVREEAILRPYAWWNVVNKGYYYNETCFRELLKDWWGKRAP